jgi:hypothetical protein
MPKYYVYLRAPTSYLDYNAAAWVVIFILPLLNLNLHATSSWSETSLGKNKSKAHLRFSTMWDYELT